MNIYIYQNVDKEVMMIAIPDIYWSVELPIEMSKDEIHEELLMQFLIFIRKMKRTHLHATFVN